MPMATAAEPRPASLPLPGGQTAATVRLHPLLVARLAAPPTYVRRRESRFEGLRALGVGVAREDYVDIPIVAFLVEHPAAGHLLIDTGLHGSVAIEPEQAMGRFGGLVFKDVRMSSDDAVPAQLRALGVAPEAVRTVIMTHLHSDHASGIAHFPEATFIVCDEEWEAAVAGRETNGYIRRQFDHGFDYRLIDFDGPEADSFASFGRALDLFGDGSVVLVSTPGHTDGHLSVVLRLANREALLAGDAIFTMGALTDGDIPHRIVDEHRYYRSLREIELYVEQTPGTLVIPGHDIEAWEGLAAVY
jgi:glyoxylase-like metal-dependent hydrolase (beta-lactamase superfamily II)